MERLAAAKLRSQLWLGCMPIPSRECRMLDRAWRGGGEGEGTLDRSRRRGRRRYFGVGGTVKGTHAMTLT